MMIIKTRLKLLSIIVELLILSQPISTNATVDNMDGAGGDGGGIGNNDNGWLMSLYKGTSRLNRVGLLLKSYER